MKIPEGWPTEEMIDAAMEVKFRLEWEKPEYIKAVVRAALAAAPTPPAQDGPVAWMYESTKHKCVSMCRDTNKDIDETETPLYTRPQFDKLRQAAEEFYEWALYHMPNTIKLDEEGKAQNLRAALEGK